jgi:glycine/D-amino acid oxidase-like deaminating enzyme
MLPIEAACYWLAQRRPSPIDPLSGDRDADVIIVGAGLTGLWTALALKELDPAVEVVILEQGVAAYGASGRNAGMLSETVDHSHGLAIEHFGEAEARRLARLGHENVESIYRFLLDRGIDCHLERTGRLMMALTPVQVEEARKTVATAERLGLEGFGLLDADRAKGEVHSPLYLGGVGVRRGGILDPVRLVDGLAGEARRLGIRLHERTRVKSIQQNGAGVVARSENGMVRARRAILATSAYTHHLLPEILGRFIPLYDYILVSDPLTEPQWQAIGWRGRQGVTDFRTFFNYYRPTRDGRILWGTSEAMYYRGNRVDESCDHSPAHYAALRDSFRHHFPAVGNLEFPYAWGGAICSTTRLTPFFGSVEGGRILYGLGYTGHGLGTTRLAGHILAAMALERPSDVLDIPLVTRRPFPYPPEPFRSVAVGAVTRALRLVDQGERPGLLLRFLGWMGIGFSS